jgi:hypothetical protein
MSGEASSLSEAQLIAPSYDREFGDLAEALSMLIDPDALAHASHLCIDSPVAVKVACSASPSCRHTQ